MYDVELRRTEKILKKKNRLGMIKNKDIYLFGVSDNTRQIIAILRKLRIEPKNVIDNDVSKQGSYCSRLKVVAFEDIDNPEDRKKVYIIYSAYWREMIPQLTEKGILKRNILRLNRKPGYVIRALVVAHRGKVYRNKLIKKYGDVPFFLCPYTGTGDIYLIGTFWNEYVKRNNISDYIFIVVSIACKKVASLFDIKNIEVTKKKKYAGYLINYYLYNNQKGKIKILNDSWGQVHTNQVEWFRGYKGLYFTQVFRKFVFELPDDVKPRHPQYTNNEDKIKNIFMKNNLKMGRTVILSPYSNTLSDLPDMFWEDIAQKLKDIGYVVITNSSGKNEPAVKGTNAVFFSLDIAPQFVEKAGSFIGVRSGFCDIISGTKAKKIILYDKGNRFYMGSAFEYFNLKDMELCEDAFEIEYDIDDIITLEEIIIKKFTN